jgi:NAD+ kinase
VITHGKPPTIGPALERLEKVAREAGVELLLPDEEVEKHGVGEPEDDLSTADIAVVLGGDGTMLRALQRFLGTEIPVVGVNFGRVGFLASVQSNELESGLARVFSGDYRVVHLTTLEVAVDGMTGKAVNDIVVLSSIRGRMVELAWALGGEDMGVQACDGMICATPAGSTAYNLSNGGPVLARGLDAMVVTFIAPHSLHARPLVVPRGLAVTVANTTPDVGCAVLVDGHRVGEIAPAGEIEVHLGDQRSLLATLPEATFFARYRETFA